MFEQFSILQMLGFFQAEWSSILAMLVVGVLYFLAPVVGYLPSRRGTLAGSLWLLILKLCVGLFRTTMISFQLLSGGSLTGGSGFPTRPGFGGGLASLEHTLMVLLPLGEAVVFLGAMVLFVLGLQRLVRQPPLMPPPER